MADFPTAGGSYRRNPVTGALTPVEVPAAEAVQPPPAAPADPTPSQE